MEIVEISNLSSLQCLRADWRDLADRLDDDSPYLTPEFLLPWIRHAWDRYGCRVLAAREGGKLIGLAPLFERSLGKWGVRFVIRSFPLYGFSPPFDILIAERHEEVMAGFAGHWANQGGWDVIELLNVRSGSRTAELLRRSVDEKRVRLHSRKNLVTSFVPVERSWDSYLASRSRNIRHNLRRGWKKCEALGDTRLVRYPGDGLGLEEAERMFFRVVNNSWKRHDGPDAEWDRFFRDLIGELDASRMLSLRFLTVGGRPVACLLEIDYRRNLFSFHIAYDLDFQQTNPGQLVLSDGLRDAHEREYGKYDFLGTKEYLDFWAEGTQSFDRIWLVTQTPASRLKTHVYFREHERRTRQAKRRLEEMKASRKVSRRRASDPRIFP